MSNVNRENYVTIQGWMLTDLNLKGTELMIYAIIFGFSQEIGQTFRGSQQYLADWSNTTTRSVRNALTSLVEKGFLEKFEKVINNVTFAEYRAVTPSELEAENDVSETSNPRKNFPGGAEKFSGGDRKNFPGGAEKFSAKNIDNNIVNNNIKDNIAGNNLTVITSMYNDTCVSFPRLTKLSDSRKMAIKARLKHYSLDDFQTLFEKAERSDFLKGANDRNWSATFDWMIKDSNMAKILDGNYDNRGTAYSSGKSDQLSKDYDWMARWGEQHMNE